MSTSSEYGLLNDYILRLRKESDEFFRLSMASLIFRFMLIYVVMQFGFAFYEAGLSRNSQSVKRCLLKTFLCTLASMLSFWLFGYALAFGGTHIFAGGQQFWAWYNLDSSNYAHFWLQFAYAATSCSIALGALAERCRMIAYLAFAFVWSGFAYPVVAHWAWHPSGWLLKGHKAWNAVSNGTIPTVQFYDAAGSGVIHMTGGIAALVGALILGARTGRFDIFTHALIPYRPHSATLTLLGAGIISFGLIVINGSGVEFLNYQANFKELPNGGNTAVAVSYLPNYNVANAMINTVLAAAFGTSSVYAVCLITKTPVSLQRLINGGLAAMASLSCSSISIYPWAAAVFGFFAGLGYLLWSIILIKLRVDDVTDAHSTFCGAGGMWGLIGAGILLNGQGIIWRGASELSGYFIAWQLVGVCAIWAWAAGCSLIIFGFLRLSHLLRIEEEEERLESQQYLFLRPKQTNTGASRAITNVGDAASSGNSLEEPAHMLHRTVPTTQGDQIINMTALYL